MKSLEQKMSRGIALGFFLLFILCNQGCVHSEAITNSVGNSYYLRYSLYKHKGCFPRVFPDRIENLRLANCDAANQFYPYESLEDVMHKGDWVRIVSFEKTREGLVVAIEHVKGKAGTLSAKPFELVLCGDSVDNISNAFAFLFSKKMLIKAETGEDLGNNLKTKQDLIDLYGFPVLICGMGPEETWYYNYVYTQRGYDQMWFSVEKGNVALVRWQN